LSTVELIRKYQKIELTKSLLLSLSSDAYRGRNIRDNSISLSQSFIQNYLKGQKNVSLDSQFSVYYKINDSLSNYNIVGIHRGNKFSNRAILLHANYDNLGTISEEGTMDSIYNGANDNASGVVALIQMAIFFNRMKFNQNIVFAFTSGKRYSMRGTCALASMLETKKIKITSAFNIEMIGRPIEMGSKKLYIKSADSANIYQSLNRLVGDKIFMPMPEDKDFIPVYSENYPIYNVLKKPSYTITSFNIDKDETYMTPSDDFDHVDVSFLHASIQNITYGIYKYLVDYRR
jgi:Zn-dependent M28 family amino/carboxypeptidase